MRTLDEVNPRGEGVAGERSALQRFVQGRNVGASSRSAAARCCKTLPIASECRSCNGQGDAQAEIAGFLDDKNPEPTAGRPDARDPG